MLRSRGKRGLILQAGLKAALTLGACAGWLITSAGCDSVDWKTTSNANDPAGSSSNPATAPSDDNGDSGESNETQDKSYVIAARRAFCCNALSYDFSAQLAQGTSVHGANFEWDFGDQRTAHGAAVQHTFPWAGAYRVRLTVHYRDGTLQVLERMISAGESSDSPIDGAIPPSEGLQAWAGSDIEAEPGAIVTLNGSDSKGSGQHELRFEWRQVAGPVVTLGSPHSSLTSFIAPDSDEDPVLLVFELVVDEAGAVAADVVSVRVARRPSALVIADAGPHQNVMGGSAVLLDGSNSTSSNSRAMAFQWTQTAGPAVTLLTPNLVQASFLAPSAENTPVFLFFELVVTQGFTSASDSVQVEVGPARTNPAPTEEQVLVWLRGLEPLQKVHYSWPPTGAWLNDVNDELLREYVRISHAVCVWGEWVNQSQLNKVIKACREVNEGDPGIPATIGVVLKPWSRLFPASAPPTYRGIEHDKEIQFFRERLNLVRGWLEGANQPAFGSRVELSAVILETERFVLKPDSEPDHDIWNNAITEKQNAVYAVAREIFPDARIEWYNRGLSELFTLREMGDIYSVTLYNVPERNINRTAFRRTVELAAENGVNEVTPWVALGSAYVLQEDGSRVWSFAYDYDLVFSWHIGSEINDPWFGDRPTQFAPWHAANAVIFWPAPWDERVPNWPRHFVAYVRGAHNITELPR